MRVRVSYRAQLKRAAGVASEELTLDGAATLASLFAHLARRHGEDVAALLLDDRRRVRPSLLVFVGADRADEGQPLRDGDHVTILAPMAGG